MTKSKKKQENAKKLKELVESIAPKENEEEALARIDDAIRLMPDTKLEDEFRLFRKLYPVIKVFGSPADVSTEQMLNRATPISVLAMIDLMLNADSEKTRATVAKDLAHMGGLKPVEKTQNVNVNVMARQEAVSLLQSKLEKLGIDVIDGEVIDETDES